MPALRDTERHHPINADGREEKCEAGKAGEEHGGETIARQRLVHQLIHSFYLVEGKIGIHSLHDRGNALGHTAGSPKVRTAKPLAARGIARRERRFLKSFAPNAPIVDVVVDTNNLPFNRRAKFGHAGNQLFNDNALREGIHFGQYFFRNVSISRQRRAGRPRRLVP